MFRPELKQPKNAAGAILVTAAFLLSIATLVKNPDTDTPFIVAAAMYVIGMVLIVIPGRADSGHDGKGNGEGNKNE